MSQAKKTIRIDANILRAFSTKEWGLICLEALKKTLAENKNLTSSQKSYIQSVYVIGLDQVYPGIITPDSTSFVPNSTMEEKKQ